jgi:hypothetical protein
MLSDEAKAILVGALPARLLRLLRSSFTRAALTTHSPPLTTFASRAYVIADNRPAEKAGWNNEILSRLN